MSVQFACTLACDMLKIFPKGASLISSHSTIFFTELFLARWLETVELWTSIYHSKFFIGCLHIPQPDHFLGDGRYVNCSHMPEIFTSESGGGVGGGGGWLV